MCVRERCSRFISYYDKNIESLVVGCESPLYILAEWLFLFYLKMLRASKQCDVCSQEAVKMHPPCR